MAMDGDSRIARYAALQSITEIGLGSVLHGLHIPLGGHFLSLNQGVLLTFAVRPDTKSGEKQARKRGMFVATAISLVTGVLKFLSPAGARALPALGISIQGVFYSSGIAAFGLNLFGVSVGFIFLSIWAFIYPLLFAFLIFGATFFEAIVKLWTEITTKLGVPVELGMWALIGAVLLKMLLSVGLAVFAWSADEKREAWYFSRVGEWTKKGTVVTGRRPGPDEVKIDSPAVGAVKDLLRPIFLISVLLTVGFVFFSGGNLLKVGGYLGRTLAVAWAIFFAIRAFPRTWAEKVQKKFPVLAQTAEEVRRSRT